MFESSRVNVPGSPAVVVQVMVADPPEERFFGVLRVKADT